MRYGETQKALKENYNGISSIKMSNRKEISELKKIIKDEEKYMNKNAPSITSEVIILIIITLIAAAALSMSIYTYEDTKDNPKDAFTSIDVIGDGGTGTGTFTASGKTKLTLIADTGMSMVGGGTDKSVSFLSTGGGGGTPGGNDKDVQFNNSGVFGGESQFTYDSSTNTLGVSNAIITDNLTASGLSYPGSDGIAGQVITTDGAGILSFTSASGVSTINGLNDASSGGTNFTDSIMLGQSVSPTINSPDNTAIGIGALKRINGGNSNIAIGSNALEYNTSGERNIALGHDSLQTTGYSSGVSTSDNIAIGSGSLNGYATTTTEEGKNIAIGYHSGLLLQNGKENVMIGYRAAASAASNLNNCIIIGANTTPSSSTISDEITLGNSSHETLRVGTQVLTSLSDGRDKTNIEETQYGLDFLMKLRPVDYTWQRRILEPGDENNPKNGKRRSGFIAQELLEAAGEDGNQILDLVYDVNPERLEARYGNLIPSMVKSIQQLENKVRMLEDKLSRRDYNISDM